MKRFRLFAGPNGSGKSSLFESLKKQGEIHTEIYISADRIENTIRTYSEFNFNAYRIKVSDEEFKNHIHLSGLYSRLGDKKIK